MKIVYTIAGTYRAAGMERILAAKANYLAAHGKEVVIVSTDQEGRPDAFPLDGRIRRVDLGIGYERNNGGPFLFKLTAYPFRKCRHRRRLATLLKRERPDVTVSLFCGDETFLPSIQDGSRKVLEVHFSRFKRLQYGRRGLWAIADRLRFRQDGRVIRRFDRFVALTEEDLGYWGHPANGVCIPNFLEEMPASPAPLDRPCVLALGRYCHQKAFDRLILAWKRVMQTPAARGWTLCLAGGGEDLQSLRDLVVQLDLTRSVKLLDSCRNVGDLYRGASVFALSSRYEGLPMVLLEAQSWGLPIVAFDCKCGPRDVVTDGEDGFLVPEGNIPALSDALLRLVSDPVLLRRMGTASRASAARWDKETIMRRWISLFENI